MHFALTVVVPRTEVERAHAYLEEVMTPFNEGITAPPRKIYLSEDQVASMAKSYETTDLRVLATKMQGWDGCDGGVDAKGLFEVSTYNEQSKWDWWVIGGRYRGWFKVKPNMPYILGEASWGEREEPEEGFGDIVRQGDVDWEGMVEHEAQEARKFWNSRDREIFGTDGATTEDEYVAQNAVLASFALLTKEGEWMERGYELSRREWAPKWVGYVGGCHFEDMLINIDYHI